jgi:teichuronic acid biosynthesis glycosyltransferase TuaG
MLKNKNNIDIILPNYNSSKFLKQTLNSIIMQTYKNWKLIIIDDCSDDKTKNILKKYSKDKRIKMFWLKKNNGAGFCRNYGIKKSKSPYVAFIDSDDVWKKNKLEKQIIFMKKNNYSFSYTNYETFGDKRKIIIPPLRFDYKSFINNTSIGTSTMMVKRKELKNIKFTNSKICEDYYFKCKLLKRVKFAFCLNEFLTRYRIRHNSMQSSNIKNIFWIWKINRDFNKLGIINNLTSIINISINSIKKYGGKNFF